MNHAIKEKCFEMVHGYCQQRITTSLDLLMSVAMFQNRNLSAFLAEDILKSSVVEE